MRRRGYINVVSCVLCLCVRVFDADVCSLSFAARATQRRPLSDICGFRLILFFAATHNIDPLTRVRCELGAYFKIDFYVLPRVAPHKFQCRTQRIQREACACSREFRAGALEID